MTKPDAGSVLRDDRGHYYFAIDDALIDDGHLAEISLPATKVYLVLCRRANKNDVAWPGAEEIARLAGISERSVYEAVDDLERHGLIAIERRVINGRGNRYRLHRLQSFATQTPAGYAGDTGRKQQLSPAPFAGEVDPLKKTQRSNGGSSTKKAATTANGAGRRRETPLPDPWEYGPAEEEIATAAGLSREEGARQFAIFRAHAETNDRRCVIWPAAFRQWCLKEATWQAKKHPTPQPPAPRPQPGMDGVWIAPLRSE